MRHYDPDDPIWTEDEDRAAAHRESYEDWAAEEDDRTRATVVGVVSDQGTVVVFRTAEGPNLVLDHTLAQALVVLLEADGEVEVEVDDWALL